jgi:hypothetical protein
MQTLTEELAALDPARRAQAEALLLLRQRAAALAVELAVDADDVFHQLQQLARTPSERLQMGLRHGRLGRQFAHSK